MDPSIVYNLSPIYPFIVAKLLQLLNNIITWEESIMFTAGADMYEEGSRGDLKSILNGRHARTSCSYQVMK